MSLSPTEIVGRLTYLNLSFYLLILIFAEWSVSCLVNRGMARRLGIRFATAYNCNITFLGVIHHELSHALLALLTGAAIHKICLYRFPWTRKKKKDEIDENCLGYVTYSCRGIFPIPQIQNALTGVAPAALGSGTVILCGIYVLRSWQVAQWTMFLNGWLYPVLFLMVSVAHHACPSGQDLKNARFGLALMFILGVICPMPADMALSVLEAAAIVLGVFVLPSIPFILLTNL